MPFVASAIGLFSSTFFSSTAVFGITTSGVFGKLLTSVAFTALQAALNRPPSFDAAQNRPGIRTSVTQTGGVNPAAFCLGEYATEGAAICPAMSHGEVDDYENGFLTYVLEVSDVPGATLNGLIIDGADAPILSATHPSFGNQIGGRFQNRAWVKYYDGTQTAADPHLLATYGSYPSRPWVSDMIGRGICYAIVTFRFDPELYDGFPNVRFVLSGIPLYDPRKDSSVGGIGAHRYADRSTWEPSNNTGVQIYNVLRGIDIGGGYIWGGSADAEDLPLADWWAAMNKADAQIALSAGGTEAQYRTGYEVFADDAPADVIEELLRATSGELAENGGVWKLRLGGPGLPVFFFSDDDLILNEPEDFTPFRADREPFNGVQASYPDPDTLWEPRDAPPRLTPDFTLTDPAQRRVADLNLAACPYPNQVQRVMRGYLEEEQRLVRHVLSLPSDAMVLEQLDVVSWTSDRRGYSAKAFEVAKMVDPLIMGQPRVTLKERDPEDTAWVPDYELPTAFPSSDAVSPNIQQVRGFTVTPIAEANADGVDNRPGFRLNWTPVAGDTRAIEFQMEASDGTSIVSVTSLDSAGGVFQHFEAVQAARAYRWRARYVSSLPSAWTAWVTQTALDVKLQPEDLDEVALQVAGLGVFGGSLQSDNFVTGVSGWQINRDGSMELQSLVTRDWLQEGALSDGTSAYLPGNTLVQDAVLWQAVIGEVQAEQLWHIAMRLLLRGPGVQLINTTSREQSNGNFNFTYSYREYSSRAFLQYREFNNGVWSGWITLYQTPEREDGFALYADVSHLFASAELVEVRVYMAVDSDTFSRTETQTSSQPNPPITTTYPRSNWQDLSVFARAVLS